MGQLRELVHHLGAHGLHHERDVRQEQLVVAADEELPAVEVFELLNLLCDRTRRDIELGGREHEAAKPRTRFEGLERIEGGKFARHLSIPVGGCGLFETTERHIGMFD